MAANKHEENETARVFVHEVLFRKLFPIERRLTARLARARCVIIIRLLTKFPSIKFSLQTVVFINSVFLYKRKMSFIKVKVFLKIFVKVDFKKWEFARITFDNFSILYRFSLNSKGKR